MSIYKVNCKKCTNKKISYDGSVYCIPIREGRKGIYIESGESEKDYVFNCDEYQTEDRQMELFDVNQKIHAKLWRKNEYESFICTNCGSKVPDRVLTGSWPNQQYIVTRECPVCHAVIDPSEEVLEIEKIWKKRKT